jgi:hypothetical protein
MNVERTLMGFVFGAVIGNIIGFTFRSTARHPIITVALAFCAYGLWYRGFPDDIKISQQAEQVMKGTPSEEAVAEAEERGEVLKPQPKVALTKVTPVPWDNAPPYERGYAFDDVEVEIANNGDVDVQDIGLNCTVKKVSDHPDDPPHSFNADRVQFVTLQAGETKTLVFPFKGLRASKLQANSFQCTPWWRIDDASALKAAGRQDLSLKALTEVRLYPGQRAVRYMRQSETVVTVAGEVFNSTKDRFVKGIQVQCESEVGQTSPDVYRDVTWINVEVLPGQTHRFGPTDVAKYSTRNGYDPVSSVCRVEQVFEEKAEDREQRLTDEAAEKEMLAKMTPLQRKEYRERRETLWGRISSLWQ